MGCWNKTCGLSNLHIYYGDPVYVFVLEKNDIVDRCYTTSFWRPVLLPFESTYDDYGGGEKSSPMLNIIIDGLRACLVEKEQGESSFHDIPVNAKELNEDMFFRAVHENRLAVKGDHRNPETEVDFVMFRKDIVDSILENFEVEEYVGNGEGTCGWGNNYIKYRFAHVLNDMDAFMDTLQQSIEESNYPQFFPIHRLMDPKNWQGSNRVARYLCIHDSYRYSNIVDMDGLIVNLMENNQREEAKNILVELVKGCFIDGFMHRTRKLWMPGGHEGSQSNELDAYYALVDAMKTAMDREREEYAQDEED